MWTRSRAIQSLWPNTPVAVSSCHCTCKHEAQSPTDKSKAGLQGNSLLFVWIGNLLSVWSIGLRCWEAKTQGKIMQSLSLPILVGEEAQRFKRTHFRQRLRVKAESEPSPEFHVTVATTETDVVKHLLVCDQALHGIDCLLAGDTQLPSWELELLEAKQKTWHQLLDENCTRTPRHNLEL